MADKLHHRSKEIYKYFLNVDFMYNKFNLHMFSYIVG